MLLQQREGRRVVSSFAYPTYPIFRCAGWQAHLGADPQTALACIADGGYGVAYRWLGATATFERWVPHRPGISDMGDLNKYDSLLVLSTHSGARCLGMPVDP